MFSEALSLVILLFLCSQSSALVMSLILIPLSIFFIMMIMSLNLNSSMILIIYVMVFIGGLLVLLISVASISSNEQQTSGMPKGFVLFVSAMLPFFIMKKETQISTNHNVMMLWVDLNSTFILISMLIIFIGLLCISKNCSKFKGMIRVI